MKLTEYILNRSEEIQRESHDFIDQMVKLRPDTKVSYTEMMQVFMFCKLAEIEGKIQNNPIEP